MGKTPLMLAAERNYDEIIIAIAEQLEDRNSSINNDDWTVLHYLAGNGNFPMMKFIMEKTENLNPKNSSGNVPLHFVAQNGRLEAVKFLINEMKISPDQKDKYGSTPLDWAITYNKNEVISYLKGLQ